MSVFTSTPLLLQIVAVLMLGLTLGSFVNVCIHRLPKNESIIVPRSYCISCKVNLSAWDNIPVLSYLLLRGKCRQCNASVSILYPMIETLTALLILAAYIKFDVSVRFFIFCLIGPSLVAITIIDIKHKIIPDIITLPGIMFGLIVGSYLIGLRDSFIGLLVGGGTFLITSEIYYRMRGNVGMGGGDIKLIAAIGALLGWQKVILIIFLSAFIGSLFGLAGLIGKRLNSLSQIPFGPFLAGGTLIAYFSGEQIIHLYIIMLT